MHNYKKKLQLNYKTNTTQNHQKIKLYGRPNNQGFKEAIFIQMGRRGRDAERGREVLRAMEPQSGMERQWNQKSNIHMWWIKIGRDTSGARDPNPKQNQPAAQGSSTRKINPYNFWL